MTKRVQVLLDKEEEVLFRSQAKKESKSLSAWMRDAARKAIAEQKGRLELRTSKGLKQFFAENMANEEGCEPDWSEHKRLILNSHINIPNLEK